MLVNCPKCGFSQPKDQYCAKCGVDMENFRPARPSIFRVVLGSPYLHVSLVFALMAFSIFFIRQQLQEHRLLGADGSRSSGFILDKKLADSETNSDSPDSTEHSSIGSNGPTPEAPTASTSAPAGDSNTSNSQPAAATAAAAALAAASALEQQDTGALKAGNVALKIEFVEMDGKTLKQLPLRMNTKNFPARTRGSPFYGELEAAAIKNSLAGAKTLDSLKQNLDSATQNYQLFRGTHRTDDIEQEQGMAFFLTLHEWTNDGFRGDLEIVGSYKEDATGLKRRSFVVPLELIMNRAMVIGGLLPNKIQLNAQEEEGSDPFLQIFKSKNFQSGQSEFTLIISFDTPTAKSE